MDGGRSGESPLSAGVSSAVFITSVSDDTDVPARSGSTGRSPPGNHVPDAPYNTGCDLTVPQSLGTVNQIQKETSAAARAGPLRLCLQTSRMARDVRADGAGLHFAVVDGERAAQIDLCDGTPGLEALIGRVACGGKLRLRLPPVSGMILI